MQLYIGNKNYSSWSMRPWLLMKHAGIPFEEKKVRLGWEDDSPFKNDHARARALGPRAAADRRRLRDLGQPGDRRIRWPRRFPDKQLWPRDPKQRARARSLCAEMHSGFGELRSTLRHEHRGALPEIGARMLRDQPGVRADLKRIVAMWSEAARRSGGPVPLRRASASPMPTSRRCARACAPTACRCRRRGTEYVDRMLRVAGVPGLDRDALAEHDWIPRTSRTGRAPETGRARATEGEAGRGPLLLWHLH